MKTFCEFLREHPMKIINFNFKKKKKKLSTKEQQESYEIQKYICIFVIFVKKNLKIFERLKIL